MEEILHALKCATDQNPTVLKSAEEWLQKLEKGSDFHVTLSAICHRYDIEWTIRWLAVVYLKNGIDRYWRPNLMDSLDAEKKLQIRQNILCCMEEPVDQIAVQAAVIIAKIARFDYPKDWHDLFSTLFTGLSANQSILHQRRCLLTLKHVVKMLSTKRLPNARGIFMETGKTIFGNVFQLWIRSHELLKDKLKESVNSTDINPLVFLTENQLLWTKIMRCVIVCCPEQNIQNVYDVLFHRILDDIAILQHCKDIKTVSQQSAQIVIGIMKALESLLFLNPASFRIGAKSTMSMLCSQIHANAHLNRSASNEKFLIRCMNLIKSMLEDDEFTDVLCDQDGASNQWMENLFQYLISYYLPLTEQDLNNWGEDPETFANEEVGVSCKYTLRPSTEVLVLALLKKFPDSLVPQLLIMLKSVQDLDIHNVSSAQSANDPVLQSIMSHCSTPLECMVRKEAIYYTVGLGVYEMIDNVNFEEWLLNKLMPEIKSIQADAHSKLMHRRILWLISQWAEVKPSDELRPILYSFVVSSLNNSFDLVVRLTASTTVQSLLDDFEFDISVFQAHQDACIQGLYDLLIESESCETKMRVLNVLSYLIERLSSQILPYEKKISNIIPQLWDHAVAENHDMLKCTILCAMVQFIAALGPNSFHVNHLTMPLIKESTNLSHASHIYLLNDGLDLWLCMLHNCTEPTEQMYELFSNIYSLLEYGSETLKTCFLIIEAYVFLSSDGFMVKHSPLLDQSFASLATDVRNECLVLVSRLVQLIVEISPEGVSPPCTLYCQDALQRIFYEQDCVLLSANLTLFAQIVLKNSTQFWEFLHNFCQLHKQEFSAIVFKLIKVWCDSMDSIVETDKRKLSSLALLTLLDVVHEFPVIANCFGEIICACVQVLYDVCDENHIDMLFNESDQDVFETEQEQVENTHDKRKRLLRKESATTSISLPAFASAKFKFLKEKLPDPSFMQLISTVNPETVKELNEFISSY